VVIKHPVATVGTGASAAGGMKLRVRIAAQHILLMATANISPCLPLAFRAVDDDDTSDNSKDCEIAEAFGRRHTAQDNRCECRLPEIGKDRRPSPHCVAPLCGRLPVGSASPDIYTTRIHFLAHSSGKSHVIPLISERAPLFLSLRKRLAADRPTD
jgi:hypothetical protein